MMEIQWSPYDQLSTTIWLISAHRDSICESKVKIIRRSNHNSNHYQFWEVSMLVFQKSHMKIKNWFDLFEIQTMVFSLETFLVIFWWGIWFDRGYYNMKWDFDLYNLEGIDHSCEKNYLILFTLRQSLEQQLLS